MENENKAQVIYFKDLLFAALYQWKKMLLAGVVFAVLFGALGILSQKDTVSVGGVSVTPEITAKVESLEKRMELLDLLIENQSNHADNTLILNIDPYSIYTSSFYLSVQPQYGHEVSEVTENADVLTLLYGYQSHLLSSQTLDAAAQKLNLSARDVQSMLTLSVSTQRILTFQASAASAQQAQALADFAMEAVNEYTATLGASAREHTVSVITAQSGPTYSSSIADQQHAARKKLTDYESERASIETELKKYAPTQLTAGSTSPMLYAAVGGILGVCLVAGIAWLAHLGSGKIYSGRVLASRTGIRVLGCVQSTKKRCGLDRWLRRLEGRSGSQALEPVAVNIRNRCAAGSTLLIMGRFQADTLEPVTKLLAEAGIHCKLCSDPAEKVDALEALPGCDGVVLAEVCGSSRYDDVEWAMQTVADHGKPLLGCVLIDG